MIKWADEELSKASAEEITVQGISIGSLRYMKAALALMIRKREEQRAEKAQAGWPNATLRSLDEGIDGIKKIAEIITHEPSEVLWEVMPKELAAGQGGTLMTQWDVFISHASEDKEAFARPLAEGLRARGLKVWFDEFTLTVGDSLRRSIDRGLAHSRFGIVIISPDFLRKEWPQKELDGLVAREVDGVKVILPVWHGITADEIRKRSPLMADRLAVSSDSGLDHVISELLRAIGRDEQPSLTAPSNATAPTKSGDSRAPDQQLALQPVTVPLIEAATRAYEQTRGTLVAAFAEAPLGREDRREGTLTWYCWALGDRLAIYGNWPPSRVPEKINWMKARNRHSFRMRDGTLVFQAHGDSGNYENLYVLASELPKALDEIKALAPEAVTDPQEISAQAIGEDLARLIFEARPIIEKLQDHDARPPTGDIGRWNNETAEYLRKNMGLAYEARFTEPCEFSDAQLGPLGRHHVNVLKVGLQHKIKLLYEFVEEAKARSM